MRPIGRFFGLREFPRPGLVQCACWKNRSRPRSLKPHNPCDAERLDPKISPRYVYRFVEQLVGEDLHAKRVLSLANGVVGVMHAAALAIHFIGQGLALAEGTDPKHAIKQVDRLLSNPAIWGVGVLCALGAVRGRAAKSAARRA
jgi:hypothetical protein